MFDRLKNQDIEILHGIIDELSTDALLSINFTRS